MKGGRCFGHWVGLAIAVGFLFFDVSMLPVMGFAQQRNIAVVDRLLVEQGGDTFYARSLDTQKRYRVDLANCTAFSGEMIILVVEAGRGMGFYSNRGSWCLVKEMWPVD